MTLEDFERAKAIQNKISIINGNLTTLQQLADNAYGRPLSQHSFSIYIDDDPNLAMLVDLEFIEMVIEYYEREIEALEAEFAALGKEHQP